MNYSVSDLGYPIAHVKEDCTAILTKAENTGGKVSRNTIREQLVYEIHDPTNYITPDVVVDLSNVKIENIAENQVSLSGIKGKPRPEKLKLSIGQMEGYVTEQFFFFSYPYTYDKVEMFIKAVKETWQKLPVQIVESRFNIIGVNGLHEGAVTIPEREELNQRSELGVRVALKHKDDRTGKMAIAGITCLGLNGPPGVISVPGWGNMNRAMLSLFPCLIPRELIQPVVNYIEI
jgi:hypothetical protein